MSFFDAPWHIIILLVVVLLLFGSSRLPGAAKALGSSMHIFKKSYQEGMEDTTSPPATAVPAPPQPTMLPPQAPAEDATQQQIRDLQRQLDDLQRQTNAPRDQSPR